MINSRLRFLVIRITAMLLLFLLIFRLFDMQVLKGKDYKELSDGKFNFSLVEKAPRGNIYDRYGNTLVSNRTGYSLIMSKCDMPEAEFNEMIKKLSLVFEKHGYILEDVISVPQYPFVVAEDVDVSIVSEIRERQEEFPCISVSKNYFREFSFPGYASHILGRTGKLSADEYAKLKVDGYSYSDVIGKQGIEKTAEKYLRGIDGIGGVERDISGKTLTLLENQSAIQGNSVILTIDMNLQKIAEDSLAYYINKIRSEGGEKTGADADSGALVVLDVKTGDVLACASYPTYNLQNFNKEYSFLLEQNAKPLWNRAVSGTYTPGSTFKPLVAIAALETGNVGIDEKITDEGVYGFYADYQPKCWIWQENHLTHGNIGVSDAIKNSCNYFFYEIGRRTGIDDITKYASAFGLGERTGIELFEEIKGSVASPLYKSKMVKNEAEKKWFAADTLQASIGQSYHAITPVQLASYTATVANGGKRFKLNLIKSVRNPLDNSIIYEAKPQVLSDIKIKPENINLVREGMKNVVDEGSAYEIFAGYPIEIGGKTGTAQLGTKASNNAFFTAFAPFDEPEIAVCVVIEHGVRGANAAYVARDIFDYYFGL